MNNNKSLTTSKSFCKVCFDAGKPEAFYTNHFVKSEPGPKGKVVCPTLLSMKCSYCKDTGHTVKYCAKASNKNKIEKNEPAINAKTTKKNMKTKKNVSNRFTTLDSDEDNNDHEELEDGEVKDDFPPLCYTSIPNNSAPLETSYAATVSALNNTSYVPHDFKTHRWADDELTDDDEDELRMKYKRVCKPPLKNNFIIHIHDHDKLDDLSDTSFHDYDGYDDGDDYSETYLYDKGYAAVDNDEDCYDYYDYAPADILNSVTCVNWRNGCR